MRIAGPLVRRHGTPKPSGSDGPQRAEWSESDAMATVGERPTAPVMNADVASQVSQALRATGHLCLRRVRIRVAEGLLILRGEVPSYHVKQVALAAALRVAGVKEMQFELEVVSTSQDFQ
jgi:osmotically-inducible protein OsmY